MTAAISIYAAARIARALGCKFRTEFRADKRKAGFLLRDMVWRFNKDFTMSERAKLTTGHVRGYFMDTMHAAACDAEYASAHEFQW